MDQFRIFRDSRIVVVGEREFYFGRKLILFDMLTLLAQSPQTPFTKEALAQSIWGQPYHPLQHDPRLYVSVSRLRRMFEADPARPLVIRNERDGYSLFASVVFV